MSCLTQHNTLKLQGQWCDIKLATLNEIVNSKYCCYTSSYKYAGSEVHYK